MRYCLVVLLRSVKHVIEDLTDLDLARELIALKGNIEFLVSAFDTVHIEHRYTVFAFGLADREGHVRIVTAGVSRLTKPRHKVREDLNILFVLYIVLERNQIYFTIAVIIFIYHAVSVFVHAYWLGSANGTHGKLDAFFKIHGRTVVEACDPSYGHVSAYIKTDKVLYLSAFGEGRLGIVSVGRLKFE